MSAVAIPRAHTPPKKQPPTAKHNAFRAVRAAGLGRSAHDLAEFLIVCCGPEGYTDVKVKTMAAQLGVGERQIYTLLGELKDADLIARTQRGHGTPARTIVLDYRLEPRTPPPAPTEIHLVTPDELLSAAATAYAAGDEERAKALSFQAAMRKAQAAPPTEAPFFGPISPDPNVREGMIQNAGQIDPPPINSLMQNINAAACPPTPHGEGGRSVRRTRGRSVPPETPATERLRELAAQQGEEPSTQLLQAVADQPIEAVERIAGELRRRLQAGETLRRSWCGYFDALQRGPIWRRAQPQPNALDSPDDPGGRTRFACEHGMPRGACPQCYRGRIEHDPPPDVEPPPDADAIPYADPATWPRWLTGGGS